MRRVWMIALFAAAAFLLLATLAQAQPKMFIPQQEFDFGYVPQSCKVTHVFWIKSVGSDSLKIIDIKPGWGCTQAPIKKKELAVGDSTELEIIYMTGSRPGMATKRPKITTNEGTQSAFVSVSADAVSQPDSTYPITIKSPIVHLDENGILKADGEEFSVTNVSDQTLELKLVSSPPGYFDVTLPAKIKPGETAACCVVTRDPYRKDNFEKSFTLELNDDLKTRFTVAAIQRINSVKVISSGQIIDDSSHISGKHWGFLRPQP